MKQLIWKEWYELRRLPLLGAAVVAMMLICFKLYMAASLEGFAMDNVLGPLCLTWLLLAVMAGAGLFAQEIGSGNLMLLDSLPMRRSRIWLVKSLTSFGVFLLSVLVSLVVWAFIVRWLTGTLPTLSLVWGPVGSRADLIALLLVSPGFFAAALAVSPFTDRAISAFGTTVIAGIPICILAITVVYSDAGRLIGSNADSAVLFIPLAFLIICVCLSISYWTFTRGESLRSKKRFRIGLQSGLASLALAAFAFWVGLGMNWW